MPPCALYKQPYSTSPCHFKQLQLICILAFFRYRITDCLRLERTSESQLVQAPCSSRTTYSQLPRTVSRWLLNISKEGDSTASLGNLCQCSVTAKKCFLMFRGNLLCLSLCPLPLVLSLGATEKSLALSSLHPPFRYLYTLLRHTPPSLLFSRLNSPSSHYFLAGAMLQSLHHLNGPSLDSLQYVHVSLVPRSPEMDIALQVWPHSAE